jgi:AcrR family transcriptional regulator
MTDVQGVRSQPRTRRRGLVLEHAILDAAWEEIAAVGYAQVTMAAVAGRSGTNKAAVYRRWPNRTELLAAAIDRHVVPITTTPIDTGVLRDDVVGILRVMRRRCEALGIIPDLGEELAGYVRRQAAGDALDQMDLALQRAKERGECILGSGNNSPIVRLPVLLLYSELSLRSAMASDRLIIQIVDEVFLPLTVRRGRDD